MKCCRFSVSSKSMAVVSVHCLRKDKWVYDIILINSHGNILWDSIIDMTPSVNPLDQKVYALLPDLTPFLFKC